MKTKTKEKIESRPKYFGICSGKPLYPFHDWVEIKQELWECKMCGDWYVPKASEVLSEGKE